MPSISDLFFIDADGIHVPTRQQLVDYFTEQYQGIYGPDIVLTSDSPDGQKMNIDVQAILDICDKVVQVYDSFDPDQAIGRTLDQRIGINGIQRQAGTFTKQNVEIENNVSVNLYGLDQEDQEVYTVQDNIGNQWQLVSTQLGLAAGTHNLEFQASKPGEQISLPNTITLPVTTVLGVISINNPTSYTTLGLNEESDVKVKTRRQRSVSISAQGFRDAMQAALENVSGVTAAYVYENDSDATDGDGTPEHSIWAIVGGSPEDADVAQAIYLKRSGGCGMRGAQTYTITQKDGTPFVVKWDVVETEDLFIQFDAESINGIDPIDIAAIKEYLVENFKPGVYERVDINHLATLVQAFDPNCLVLNAGFADNGGGPFTQTLRPSLKNKQFSIDAANIDITEI